MDEKFPSLVSELYRIVEQLEQMFPGRHFTPDGHMVGSLGECLAAYHYDLNLLPASTEGRDATKGDLDIEIKATQADKIALRNEPKHLLVLKLYKDGSFDEVYNGSGRPVWVIVSKKPRPRNGQYQISINKLKELMLHIPQSDRIKRTSRAPA